MARYTADPTQDTAGFEVIPSGTYRFKVGEPKAFKGETKEGDNKGKENYGIAFMLTAVDGPVDVDGNTMNSDLVGKKLYHKLYYHTQESRNFSKGFVLAVFGFSASEEKMFNDKLKELKANEPDNPALDWSFDPDTGECGTAWRGMVNGEVVMDIGVKKNGDREQNTIIQTRPVPVPASA